MTQKKTDVYKLLRKNIQQLKPYDVMPETCEIKMDANENNWLNGWFQEAFAKRVEEIPLHQYPDTDCLEIRKKLATLNQVHSDQILTGVGSDQIIAWIIQAFVEPGDGVVTMHPTFGMYAIDTWMAEGSIIEVPLNECFQFQPEVFLTAIQQEDPKVVFITNPNNPTGGVIPRVTLNKLLREIPSETIMVIDEAYYEFYGESMVGKIEEYPNLIVLRTLSKAYGLAGVRAGYAMASEDMIKALSRVKPPYHMSSLDQTAALVCLEMVPQIKEELKKVIHWREKISLFFFQLKKEATDTELEIFPSATNFLLIRSPQAEKLNATLKKHGIRVRGYGTQGVLANCLRITIGTEKENRKLQEVVKKHYEEGE